MKLPHDLVRDLQISGIRRLHERNLPAHRQAVDQSKRVQISLRDSYERDVVISYASNLEKEARIDIVIPEHLRSLKHQFDGLSYKLRRHAKLSGDKKIMTSLRLDDKTESLTMAVRDEKDQPWLMYTLEELRQLESKLVRTERENKEDSDEEV